jgi:hypothetical protein
MNYAKLACSAPPRIRFDTMMNDCDSILWTFNIMGLGIVCALPSRCGMGTPRCFSAPNSLWESPSWAMAHGMGPRTNHKAPYRLTQRFYPPTASSLLCWGSNVLLVLCATRVDSSTFTKYSNELSSRFQRSVGKDTGSTARVRFSAGPARFLDYTVSAPPPPVSYPMSTARSFHGSKVAGTSNLSIIQENVRFEAFTALIE